MNIEEIKRLKRGQSMVYYVGDLARDANGKRDLSAMRDRVYGYAAAGVVNLVQRKVRGGYEYIAIGRRN